MLTALFAVAAAEAGGFSSPFEVNFGLFFWTWVIFIMLFFALKRFAWPAILEAVEKREQKIAAQLAEAERAAGEAAASLEEHRKLLQGAKQEAQELVQQARSVAEKEREGLMAKARAEHDEMLERAKREIAAERDRAVAELRKEAVDLSLAAASRLVQERLTSEADRKIVTEYLSSLGKGS